MGNGTTELDRPIPLYMQVVRQLRAQIAAGELNDGDTLPSQRQMMARWQACTTNPAGSADRSITSGSAASASSAAITGSSSSRGMRRRGRP